MHSGILLVVVFLVRGIPGALTDAGGGVLVELAAAGPHLVGLPHEAPLMAADLRGELFPGHVPPALEHRVQLLRVRPYRPLVPKVPPDDHNQFP